MDCLKVDELFNIDCSKCTYKGEFTSDKKEIPNELLLYERKNQFSIRRNHINYFVEVYNYCNRKKITISTDNITKFKNIYDLLMEIIRFDNFYEGRFFSLSSCLIDDVEYYDIIKNIILEYINSKKYYLWFPFSFSDSEYKKAFIKFNKYIKKTNLIHQVFLYSTFSNMPVDLKMAMLLEVFEPIANSLAEKGEIVLTMPPYITVSKVCKNCGRTVSKKIRNNRLSLSDRLIEIMKVYGKNIFAGDSNAKIIKKAVINRNKIDHVDKKDNSNGLNGSQCGFYLMKFSVLYRIIILYELDIMDESIEQSVTEWINQINENFQHLRIMP